MDGREDGSGDREGMVRASPFALPIAPPPHIKTKIGAPAPNTPLSARPKKNFAPVRRVVSFGAPRPNPIRREAIEGVEWR
jgi:hypothetical protein